jgi:hypothetical protein
MFKLDLIVKLKVLHPESWPGIPNVQNILYEEEAAVLDKHVEVHQH